MEALQRLHNRGSISTGYDIENSCMFEADSAHFLKGFAGTGSRTPTSSKIGTISFWIKRTELGIRDQWIISGSNSARSDGFKFDSSDRLAGYFSALGSGANFVSSQVFRDTSAWYHFVFAMDTSNGTAGDRFKIYVNGERITAWGTAPSVNQNTDLTLFNSGPAFHGWGTNSSYYDADGSLSAYLADLNFIDGQQLAPTSFGEVDDSGIWKPIDTEGLTFGSRGYRTEWKDPTSTTTFNKNTGGSNPYSEGGGYWTGGDHIPTAANQATDTPTNNFCTWSPLWAESRANGTITEGATQVAWGGSAWKIARSSMAVSKGRWYWEIKGANVTGDTWNNNLFGFASVEGDNGQYGPTVLLGYSTGNYYYRVANSQTGSDNWGNAGGAWSSSDTFGFALDLESSTKKFILYRNGSAVNGSGTDLVSAFQTEQFFTPYATAYNGDTQFLNWGGYTVNTISSAATDANDYGTFEYAPPSGYYALCSKNLAEFGG